jgi:hypothetical protein
MPRYAIIDTAAGKVINVVEYETAPSNPPPGFEAGIIALQDDRVGPDWGWNGTALVPPAAAPDEPAPQTVQAQDLMAQFTAVDIVAIQAAISSDTSKMLLWYSLLAQRDPMHVNNDRFLAGWRALIDVLGIDRMNAIAGVLGVTV